jgi:hypothetical protein
MGFVLLLFVILLPRFCLLHYFRLRYNSYLPHLLDYNSHFILEIHSQLSRLSHRFILIIGHRYYIQYRNLFILQRFQQLLYIRKCQNKDCFRNIYKVICLIRIVFILAKILYYI